MQYQVVAVDDGDLPSESPWAHVRIGDRVVMFIACSRFATPALLSETLSAAWTAVKATEPRPLVPAA